MFPLPQEKDTEGASPCHVVPCCSCTSNATCEANCCECRVRYQHCCSSRCHQKYSNTKSTETCRWQPSATTSLPSRENSWPSTTGSHGECTSKATNSRVIQVMRGAEVFSLADHQSVTQCKYKTQRAKR
jgi:hypothetical protein